MSTLGTGVLTLVDFAKRLDPDGKTSDIAELLSQNNGVIKSMLWKEGNLPTGHRVSMRTGLPTTYWRAINQGIPSSKSTTVQVDEGCGMLESWSTVDKDLAELNGNTSAFRLSEASAFVESMAQEFESTLFLGNTSTAPEEFMGLAPRFNAISGATNGQNVVSAGGSQSDNSSIWLVGWGEQTIHGIFPKGSKAGLVHEDLGLQTVQTSVTGIGQGQLRAYQDHWQMKAGLCVKDWRYAVRGCNIDISNLIAKSSAADLFDLMIKMLHRIPNLGMCKPVYYMNRTCFEMLDIQRRDDAISAAALSVNNVDGEIKYAFRGIPVVVSDALLENESTIS